ncbi:MAG: hypothetical protein ACLFU0_10085 [Alphaproteobacteria bacterium]
MPEVFRFDETQALVVMEHLTPHIILRKGLIAAKVYPKFAALLAPTLFKTSHPHLFAAETTRRMKVFRDNTELDRHTSAKPDALTLEFRRDATPIGQGVSRRSPRSGRASRRPWATASSPASARTRRTSRPVRRGRCAA